MANILTKLRNPETVYEGDEGEFALFEQAADEIERLRAANYALKAKLQIQSGQSVENVELDKSLMERE